MKYILANLLLLFVSYSAFSQSEKEIAADKIKTETVMISDDKSGIETYRKESYTAYDQNGNTVEEIQYNDDGSVKEHIKYTYNSSNLKSLIARDFKVPAFSTIITFNGNDILITIIFYIGLSCFINYIYNKIRH